MVTPGILSSLHPPNTTVWIKKLSEDDLYVEEPYMAELPAFLKEKILRGGEEMGLMEFRL